MSGLVVGLFDGVLLAQVAADSGEPLLPLKWGVWFVVGVQQEFPARRTAPTLGSEEPGGVLVQGRALASPPPFGPVPVPAIP
jgi:hypothetical protein